MQGSKKLTVLLLNDFHPIKNIHGGSKRIMLEIQIILQITNVVSDYW